MDLLKFITCGSVDDGKSTLIGHMLYSAKLIFADQNRALELDSRVGSADGALDYSLLLDGLEAEREQGITIDVAYRYFSTKKRSFIVADTPGHEEYTRNMAVGASFAQLAVILVDAQQGVLLQTRRHARICALMGIRDFVFAINKMDLVNYDRETFRAIGAEIAGLLSEYPVHSLQAIPVSATVGDNLTEPSHNTPWYEGLPLLPYLESVVPYTPPAEQGFCMPVQRVSRPNHSFRGFQGEGLTGTLSVGDSVTVLPSGEQAYVKRLLWGDKDVELAKAGRPITLCLDREIDVSRGCVVTKEKALHVGNRFAASVLWMNQEPLHPGDRLRIRLGTASSAVTVTRICHRVDLITGGNCPAPTLEKNALGLCELETGIPLVYDVFSQTASMGELILIDPVTHMTAACGVIEYPLGEEGTVFSQKVSITRQMREHHHGHRAVTVWFTGLSGAGKSTLADLVEQRLFSSDVHTMLLDGDNVRMGLCKGLGFSPTDRSENLRRVAQAAKLLNDAGITVLAAFVSPLRRDRAMVKEIIGDAYLEVYVKASLDACIARDVKGMYKKALRGEIREFTGISSPYEISLSPDVTVDTEHSPAEVCCSEILEAIREKMK